MRLRIENNKKYKIPCERLKEAHEWCLYEMAERERINKMTQEEYDFYMQEELKKCDERLENGEFYTLEEVMLELRENMKAFEKEKINYNKWMSFIKRREKLCYMK